MEELRERLNEDRSEVGMAADWGTAENNLADELAQLSGAPAPAPADPALKRQLAEAQKEAADLRAEKARMEAQLVGGRRGRGWSSLRVTLTFPPPPPTPLPPFTRTPSSNPPRHWRRGSRLRQRSMPWSARP